MQSLVVFLLLLYLLPLGLGDFVVRARLPEVAARAQDLELLLLLGGLLATLRAGRSETPPRPRPHHLAALAFLALLAGHVALAPPEYAGVALTALFVYGNVFLSYFLSTALLRSQAGRRGAFALLVLVALVFPLPALYQAGFGVGSMPQWFDGRFDPGVTRASGPLGNPIVLAGICQLSLAWITGLLADPRLRRGPALLLGLLGALLLPSLLVSYTRAAWGGLVVAAGLLVAWRRPRPWRALVLPGLFCLLVLLEPSGWKRATATTFKIHVSTSTRVEMWKYGWKRFQAAPWLGHGLGRECGVAANNAGLPGAFYAHNYPLQVGVEMGLLGLVPFSLFWILYLLEGLFPGWVPGSPRGPPSAWRLGLLTGLVGYWLNAMVVCNFEYRPGAVLVGLLLALGEHDWEPLGPEDGSPGSRTPESHWLLPAALPLALGVAVVGLQVHGDRTQLGIQEALGHARAGRREQARQRLEPLTEAPWPWLRDEAAVARKILEKLSSPLQGASPPPSPAPPPGNPQ